VRDSFGVFVAGRIGELFRFRWSSGESGSWFGCLGNSGSVWASRRRYRGVGWQKRRQLAPAPGAAASGGMCVKRTKAAATVSLSGTAAAASAGKTEGVNAEEVRTAGTAAAGAAVSGRIEGQRVGEAAAAMQEYTVSKQSAGAAARSGVEFGETSRRVVNGSGHRRVGAASTKLYTVQTVNLNPKLWNIEPKRIS
jgi:hypothetical protein